jgi:S-DNA-T family DNA segregation ATPase FtsK/SpoIIIE
MKEALEKRGIELLGLMLIAIGISIFLLLWSYSPDDRSFWSISDVPTQNMLGAIGASIAAPLILILGWGSFTISIFLVIWGVRFLCHIGVERAITRMIFFPVSTAFSSVFFATLVPSTMWVHQFGLGGLFGETSMGIILKSIPEVSTTSVNTITLSMVIVSFLSLLFVCGFSRREVSVTSKFLFTCTILFCSKVFALLAKATFLLIPKKVSIANDLPGQDNVLSQKKSGVINRILYKFKLSFGKNTSQSLRQEPKIDNEGQDEDNRIRNKISLIIKDRTPPLTNRVADTPEVQGNEKALTTSFLTSNPTMDRAEPSVSGNSQNFHPELEQDKFSEDGYDELTVFEDKFNPDPSMHGYNLPKVEAKKLVHAPISKTFKKSKRAIEEAEPRLNFDNGKVDFEFPPLNLLATPVAIKRTYLSDESLEENARLLEAVLDDYGIKGEIVSVRPGPVVTMYELEPAPGLKASRVIGLADDIARSMSALAARVSTVPGRTVIGIELPNEDREKVVLSEIFSSRAFGDGNQKLPLALGKDIGGEPVVANLAKMPHLLIAGTTGSGKSVAINTMILSLLYKLTPEECKMIMIDPKMLELSVYDGIPHLLSPVVTDPKKAVVALKWVVGEMEERYRRMSKMGVRNIDGFNSRVSDALLKNENFSRTIQTGFDDETGDPIFETEEFEPEKMPYIVVVVDEMADLMMVAGKEIEACIQRLAQMARASGIHIIMATQRPSVDVITGTIKANFPTRISFQVTSKIDSRTILGEMGAEQLLGMGDMLYMAGGSKIIRCHGPFVSDEEVEEVVRHLKAFGPPNYMSGVIDGPDGEKSDGIDMVLGLGGNTEGEDAVYDEAVSIVLRDRKCSTSYIQRKLSIGYNKAARLVEQMEEQGLVSSANHVGKREILVPEQ